MVAILTDSTSDLSPALVARYNLEIVPLQVHIGERTLDDSFDFTPDDLFTLVETSDELPKTASPSVGTFLRQFEAHEASVYVGISSELSASVRNAQLAAEQVDDREIHVVDSLTLSSGVGLLAIYAAELRNAGDTAEEIAHKVRAARSRVRMSFLIDTMRYLYMGGRCTALQNLMGTLLNIRPIIYGRRDGTLDVKEKVRGSARRGLRALLDDFEAHVDEIDLRRVFVTHSSYPEGAERLVDALNEVADIGELLVTEAGAVVSSHCGPGTVGILYMLQP